jgi:hypothetical protein
VHIDSDGQFTEDGSCPTTEWLHDIEDQRCVDVSSIALSDQTRIIVGVFIVVLAGCTLFFWIRIFPKLYLVNPASLMTIPE